MKEPSRHLPFVLVVLWIGLLGFTDLSMGFGIDVLVTLLAPMLWLGLYGLCPERPQSKAV